MPYLTDDELKDGTSSTIAGGETRKLVPLRYEPFQTKKGKTMPKHILKDIDSNQELEVVGYAFRDAIKTFNDKLVPSESVLKVECLDNGTAYPDFKLELIGKVEGSEVIPF